MTSQWKSCHAGRMTAKRLLPSATQHVFNLAGPAKYFAGNIRTVSCCKPGRSREALHPPLCSPPPWPLTPCRRRCSIVWGNSTVYSVLRNVQEPAGSWGGDCARMKHPPPQGSTAGQQPPASSKHTAAVATQHPERGTCLLPYPGVCRGEGVRRREVEMVRCDSGTVSRKGARSGVGGFPCLPLPLRMVRRGQRCRWRWESWQYRERLGAAVGEEGDVPFGCELQTGPGCAWL